MNHSEHPHIFHTYHKKIKTAAADARAPPTETEFAKQLNDNGKHTTTKHKHTQIILETSEIKTRVNKKIKENRLECTYTLKCYIVCCVTPTITTQSQELWGFFYFISEECGRVAEQTQAQHEEGQENKNKKQT